MSNTLIPKLREHLGKAKAAGLMMANTQAPAGRTEYLKRLSDEIKKAVALLDKMEKE